MRRASRDPLGATGFGVPPIAGVLELPEPVHGAGRANHERRGDLWDTYGLNFGEDSGQDAPPAAPNDEAVRRPIRPPPRGWIGKVLVFFGQAGPDARERSQLISLVWTLSSGLVQVRSGFPA